MMSWLNENAGAIQGLATIVLVGVTVFYAFYTKKLNQTTRDEVEATRAEVETTRQLVEVSGRQVEATRDQVEMTRNMVDSAVAQAAASQRVAEESQRQRAQAFLPVLVPRFDSGTSQSINVQITNVGVGTALNVELQYLVRNPEIISTSEMEEVGDAIPPHAVVPYLFVTEKDKAVASVIGLGGKNHFAFKCRYSDINGAIYESITDPFLESGFTIHGLNDQAKFALGKDRKTSRSPASREP